MLQIKEYVKVKDLEEAYELNQKKSSVILGGMHWLKMSTKSVGTAIDLSDLGLDTIEETEDFFEIGAMVTLRQLELHDALNAYTMGAVRDAVKDIVGVQFRNTATVGGSIFGRYGFSDVLTVFLAMDSFVECYGVGVVPLAEFAAQPYDRDVVVKLILQKTPMRMAYLAQRHARTDFPMLTCAVSCLEGVWRASIGARPGRAVLVSDEEGILGDFTMDEDGALSASVTEEAAGVFGEYVADRVEFGSNMRGTEDYRRQIAPVLIRRALMKTGKE